MHYILAIDLAWDLVIGASFWGIARALIAAVRTGKVGIVLGRTTFAGFAMSLLCAGAFMFGSAISLALGDNVGLVGTMKTVLGFVVVSLCAGVSWRVYQVQHLPPEARAAFERFERNLAQLREMHSEQRSKNGRGPGKRSLLA